MNDLSRTPAFIAAERRHLTPPEPPPILRGMIARYLTAGPHSDREVEIEYELDMIGLTIILATDIETGDDIDPQEIGEADRTAFADAIWRNEFEL